MFKLSMVQFLISLVLFMGVGQSAHAGEDGAWFRKASCEETLHGVSGNTSTLTSESNSPSTKPMDEAALVIKGAEFLHQRYPNLHTTIPVEKNAFRKQHKSSELLHKPALKISAWLEFLQASHGRFSSFSKAMERIKAYYHQKFVTSINDIPESFFEQEIRRQRESGRGNAELGEKRRQKLAEIAIEDQKKSLDLWVDYLFSEDAAIYPMWAKYWSFMGMVKLGKFNPETGSFGHRSRGQMAPFPELNREAYAIVVDAVIKKVHGHDLKDLFDPDVVKLLEGANFGKLYGRALQNTTNSKLDTSSLEGRWVRYKRGSSPAVLIEDLRGRNTGWCSAGESTAAAQLEKGDLHIFYSLDDHGNATVPRIAIRMTGYEISEIRGIGKDQNLDPIISGSTVLPRKLEEFGARGRAFITRSSHMKRLTLIEEKHLKNESLTMEELRFLYEFGESISGFGYQKDPRIAELRKSRNIREDLSHILNIDPSKISLSKEEALSGNVEYHFGDLMVRASDLQPGIDLPKAVSGALSIEELNSAKDFHLPLFVGGTLRIKGLESPEGLHLPTTLSGSLDLPDLKSAKGLELPISLGGSLLLDSLESPEGLILPSFIGRGLYLGKIRSIKGLVLQKTFNGDLDLGSVVSLEGESLAVTVNGDISLNALKVAKGLKLQDSLPGSLLLDGLESSEDLDLPSSVAGDFSMNSLQVARGITFPKFVGGTFSLRRLKSTEGLGLPKFVGGMINLERVESIDELQMPEDYKGFVVWGVGSESY